jgi:hypothetical protein
MRTVAASAGSNAGSEVAATFFILIAFIGYWVPTVVALIRRNEIPNVGSIVVINLFLGRTVVGWVVALAMACRSRPQQPQYVITPGWAPPGGWTSPPGPQGPPPGPPEWPTWPQS